MKSKITVRNATIKDVNELNDLDHRVWPEGSQTTDDVWEARIKTFSEGVLVAEFENTIIGVLVYELLFNYDFNNLKTWNQITDNGYLLKTHKPGGKFGYGVALSIDPKHQNSGVGTLLSKHLASRVFRSDIEEYIFGARLINYHKYFDKMTPEEYFQEAFYGNGQIVDGELIFYKKLKCKPRGIVSDYFHDPESKNFGVILTRKNPFCHWPQILKDCVSKIVLWIP